MAEAKRAASSTVLYRGKEPTPQLVMDLWSEGKRLVKNSRGRILAARAMRRRAPSSLIRLAKSWAEVHPEAASWARVTLPQRVTLERDLIARVGAVEPEYTCEPIGFRDTDSEAAEAKEAYLNEWRLRAVPTQAFAGKAVEDGEFAVVVLPADLDLEGAPDFFEYLDEQAYEDLDDEDKASYSREDDPKVDRRSRYVKLDEDGQRVVSGRYAPPSTAQSNGRADEGRAEREQKAAEQKHQDDLTEYILKKGLDASTIRVIPALDCVPIFRRGRRKQRFELVALIERTLYEPFELLEANYRWEHLGDAQLVPRGYRDDGTSYAAGDVGSNGQFYLYTAYLMCEGKDGTRHPVICSTFAGAGTWDSTKDPDHHPSGDDHEQVVCVDLYEQYGITDPLWSYHWGLHLEDDDPDFYARPYIYDLMPVISALEGVLSANAAATAVNAYTGHFQQPDAALAAAAPTAVLEQSGELRRPRMPRPGEIETSIGEIRPAQQAVVGADAWRLVEQHRGTLAEATQIDQVPGGAGPSGHALLVATTLGQVAKRQIREAITGAVVAVGEAQLIVLDAICQTFDIKWPVRTTQEQSMRGEAREGKAPSVYDPAWTEHGQWNLDASYPEEENLAKVDLEASLYERGLGSFDDVQEARGKSDTLNERTKVAFDQLWRLPEAQQLLLQRVAKIGGNRRLQEILQLQGSGEMSKAEIPGVGPVPAATVRGPAAAPPSGSATGGAPYAASVRGGIQQGTMGGAAAQQAAMAALTGGG